MLIVAALTAVGVALRLAVVQQSLYADELSTRFMVAGHGLGDVISVVHTDAEITPPLYFVASWLTTRIDFTPELLRAPSLLAGAAAIPLIYLLGVRTVGSRAALTAAALTTFSPFMIFYSTEARGYELMIVLVLGSTLCLLTAVERGGVGWWAAYAGLASAAVYTHYTSVFALAGQLCWLLVAHPEARRAGLVASGAAALGFLPWLSGLKIDLQSRTTDILSALQPFTPGFVRSSLVHWAIGYPELRPSTRVGALPGTPAIVALLLAVSLACAGIVAAGMRGRIRLPDRRVALVIVLAVSVPAGEALVSAVSSNLFGTRNLAAAWPAFALCLAALLVAGGPRLGIAAAALAVGAFAVGGIRMLNQDFARPQSDAAVAFVDRTARPDDVVIDGVSIAPGGVPTGIDIAFAGRRHVYPLGRPEVRYDPFRILAPPPRTADVVRRAATAVPGGRLFMLLAPAGPLTGEAIAAVPAGYRRVAARTLPGINPIEILVFEPQTARGA
jgi:Dolichyl-phosphate-mannose-protein mannosyltransferase